MVRKLTASLLSLLVLICLIPSASALEHPRVVDEAQLLSPEEISYLEDISAELMDTYGIDAVILTVDTLMGQSAQYCADDYYDNVGYSKDGVLFLLAMAEREWYISTSGSMIYALTDYGIQQIGEFVVPYLSDSLWFEGFFGFLCVLPEYLDAYQQGIPIDGYADYSGDYYHGEQEETLFYEEESVPNFGLSLICGIVAAGIVILVMRASMNTKKAQRGAGAYMKNGSWNLSQHHDIFLYSRVTKTRKQQTTTGGGGSSVHHSSGGRSHGGGGGKF